MRQSMVAKLRRPRTKHIMRKAPVLIYLTLATSFKNMGQAVSWRSIASLYGFSPLSRSEALRREFAGACAEVARRKPKAESEKVSKVALVVKPSCERNR